MGSDSRYQVIAGASETGGAEALLASWKRAREAQAPGSAAAVQGRWD